MPNNNPRTPKRSWRGERTASARTGKGQPSWKAEKDRGATPKLSRNIRIAGVLALFLGVAAFIVWFFFIPRSTDPFRLVLVGPGYEQNLAVEAGVLSVHTLDDMEKWSKDYNDQPFHEKGKVVDVRRPALTGAGDPVGESLANCNSQTVVVFLSGEGGGDEQGAFLLPEDGGARNLNGVYRIDKALDALQKLPEATKKLLLLDGSQHGPNWTMGRLHNDFVRAVKSEPRLAKVKHLVVLCSCGEGEKSWISEEYGQTIFGHFLIEGLKGAADRKGDPDDPEHCAVGDGNTRITVEELAKYVQCEVDRWVRRNRGFDQKPLLLDADDLAGSMELVGCDTNGYMAPDPAKLPTWTPPSSLADAWKEHEELANTSPPPAAYTPQQWRVYEASLLRYEHLLRTGGAEAGALRQTLTRLHDQIAQAQKLDRDSVSNSLAAPAAFGWSLSQEATAQLESGFKQLWTDKKAKPEQYQKLLSTLEEAAPDRGTRRLLRIRLTELLLDKAPTSHDDYLRVCAVLPKLTDPPAPPTAEANFAVMTRAMEAQLPNKAVASWDVLKQALMVRRSAETAALGLGGGPPDLPPYSEQTRAWIEAAVTSADMSRRLGEDRMFASAKEQLAASKALKEAETDGDFNYKTVREHAVSVRQAIRARDQALADLPWYTQWLARQPLSKTDEDSLGTLWGGVHDLCDLLEKPDFSKTSDLAKPTAAVNAGLQEWKQRFDKACEDMRSAKVLQRDLHELEDLLSVPLIEPGLRMSMLADARRISLELNKGTAKAAAEADDQLQDSAALAKKLGFQQGRMAAALLGKDNEEGKKAGRLLQLSEQPLWQPELNAAGDLIGRAFQNMARDAAEAAEKGRRAPIADAAAPLRLAALQTRFLDAGEANAWLSSVDPVDENRRVQLHDLLVWQAERTRLDYWASDDPANPYYRAAGLVYAGDARDLAGGGPDLKDEEKAARLAADHIVDKLNAPDVVAFRWQDGDQWKLEAERLHITDEKTVNLQYGLVGPKDAPAGRPVVWAKAGPKLIAPPDAGEPRSLERISDQPGENSATYTVTPERPLEGPPSKDPTQLPPPAREDSDFAVAGLFRGRTLALDTPVRLYNRPDLVSYQPMEPPTAHIAVQATRKDFDAFAAKNSELVVVLDYSGSMHTPQPGGGERIDKALEALEKCLDKLPKGVQLTVLTFSTKEKIGIDVERDRAPWKGTSEEKDELMGQLKHLTPMYFTPLVRATAEAGKHFTPGFKGAKTIVILTDGGDNEFLEDEGKELRYDKQKMRDLTMTEFLQQKLDPDILVNVVGFQMKELLDKKNPTAEEQQEIKGYFKYAEAVKNIGGTIEDVEEAGKLAVALKQYFLQIRYWIEDEHGNPVEGTVKDGLNISLNTENERPSLAVPAPGSYYVLIQAHRNQDKTRRKLLEQHVRVQPGEFLVLDLNDTATGFDLRRDVYALSYNLRINNPPVVEPRPADHWLLTVLGNAQVPNLRTRDAREITASLERTDDFVPALGTLRQSRPALAWFSVSKAGGKQPATGLRFYPLPNYPAPVWRLDLADDWKPADVPVLDAWWFEDALPEGVTLRQGREYKRPSELKRKEIKVTPTEDDAPTKVIVESVGWEPRAVEVRPGEWAVDQDCLVVRLRFPEGRPYFVQLPDEIRPAGYEHRFYTEADSYTGVFFGVPPAQVENLAWLKLISVEEAHRKAVRVDGITISRQGTPP